MWKRARGRSCPTLVVTDAGRSGLGAHSARLGRSHIGAQPPLHWVTPSGGRDQGSRYACGRAAEGSKGLPPEQRGSAQGDGLPLRRGAREGQVTGGGDRI